MKGFSSRPRNRSVSSGRRPANFYRQPGSTGKRSPFSPAGTPAGVKRRKFLIGAADILIVLAVIFCLIYSLIVKPQARLDINDLTYRPAEAYRQAADLQLQAVKNRNKITFDDASVISALQKKFPEIYAASVELPLLGERPILHITVSRPSFWLANQSKIYIINSSGMAVGQKDDYPGIKNLATVSDQSGYETAVGKQALGSKEAGFVSDLISACRQHKIPLQSLTLPAVAQELDLRTSDRPYFVKFYLAGDPKIQIGQFLAARHNFDTAHSQPAAYLDVRVPGKVFSK